MGERPSPAVFNTGQVLLGWLAAFAETGSGIFAGGARRAAGYLLATLDEDGLWRRGNSRFANQRATLYNARVAWALAEAGRRFGAPELPAGALRAGFGSARTGRGKVPTIGLLLSATPRERKCPEPVEPVLRFLKSTQNRTSRNPGVRGGIKGSFPLGAEYGSYQTLNWATKFFIDALLRDERRQADVEPAGATDVLA